MTIRTHDTNTDGAYLERVESGVSLYLDRSEAPQVLQDLARILGYTLVDREERASLVTLCQEIENHPNDFKHGSEAWAHWQGAAEALAAAVTSALRTAGEED